jgi:hypothetical protein
MKPEGAFWQGVRAEQDRGRARAGFLTQAKAKGFEPWPLRRPRRMKRAVVAGALTVACALAMVFVARERRSHDLSFSVGASGNTGRAGAWIAAPAGDELPLTFSDGSRISLQPESRARVAEMDASGAHVILEKGRATAAVVHRPSSHWRIDVGPFEVAVVGTRFAIGWDPNEEVFQLRLDEGAVLVSGSFLRESKRLVAGQILRAFCKEQRQETAEFDGSTSVEKENVNAVTSAPSEASAGHVVLAAAGGERELQNPKPRAPHAVPASTWQKLAAMGDFRRALEVVERDGFEAECKRASGEDLLVLGDTARLADNSARSRQAYLCARGKLPGGGHSAYGLGLLAFDHEHDFTGAAQWFEVYLREQADGKLRREAEGRLMEAWQRAGDESKARAVASQYLREYPNGTHAPLARQLTLH